ncbi:calcium-binding protein [Vogesella indigofera]|uniref:calcium-binding protein n=1 Tax=Vogesella indigofera TaxID=45465 RepID=UPI00234ED49A|nr:calcium-binding protein [Vogesella indigofera]MDC7710547.1 calcium-binding protein [Vogesella indigofera]
MAEIYYYQGNRYGGGTVSTISSFGAKTATLHEFLSDSGMLVSVFVGQNFTYGFSGGFQTGTITEKYSFSSNGELSVSATGLNVDVATRNSLLTGGGASYNYMQYELRGNDKITGSSGDDLLTGSKGNDTLDGGAGSDLLDFKSFASSVNVNLATGVVSHSYGTSSVVNVEDVNGSSYSDVLNGNAANNSFQGFGGNDTINGGSGFDTASYLDASSAVNVNLATGVVTGGSGSDTLTSIERVIGSRYNDKLSGTSANESFQGGFGNDTINGGSGVDTVEYGGVGAAVNVNLASGTASGGGGSDILTGIENVKGSYFADTIVGTSAVNSLVGGGGNDTLSGGGGADVLYGGTGRDIFRFDTALGSSDQIKDFVVAEDTIQLENSIFTKFGTTMTGTINAAFFRANTTGLATDSNDYIVYETDTGKLFYDADGSGVGASTQIAVLGVNLTLTNADFVLV